MDTNLGSCPKNEALRVIRFALLEIREAAAQIEHSKIRMLADLIHTVPTMMEAQDVNWDEIMRELNNRAERSNMTSWVKSVVSRQE